MQVKEIKNEGLKREYKITIPANQINGEIDKRLKDVAKNIKMDGFRPGKVPVKLVKKKYGKDIIAEVLDEEVNKSSKKVLSDKHIVPAIQPKIDMGEEFDINKFNEKSDFEYNMELEIFPDVPEIDIKKIEINKPKVVINSKDIDDGLIKLRKAQRDFKPLTKQRAAKKGDIVVIDFVGKTDGEAFEGGTAKDVRLELGSNEFIPGYEDQLVGAKKGESKLVKVTFPKDYGSTELAGKKAEFDVDVKDILEGKLPEVNEEFAEKLGFDNIANLRDGIKSQIERDFEDLAKVKLKKELFDDLEKSCDFPTPESMVDLEYKTLLESSKTEEKSKEGKKLKDIAIRRVKLGIILAELGRKNQITITEDELRRAVFEQARNFPGQEQQIIELYQNNANALEQLKGPIMEDKVVDFLIENIKLTDQNITTKELIEFSENTDSI